MIAAILIVVLASAAVVAGLVFFTASIARKIERAYPPTGQLMEIDGQRIHYIDRGQGPEIVMIHGLGGNLMNFSYALADRLAKDHRVVMVDRPGSGHSVRPRGTPANLAAQARTLAELIRNLQLDRPVLVGHSLGGALSLTIATNHPDCAGAVALIAPFTEGRSFVPPALKGLAVTVPLLRAIVGWTVAAPLSVINRDRIAKAAFGPDPVPADYATRGGGLLGLRPAAHYNMFADLAAADEDMPAIMATYPSITYPVAMLYGRGDQILDFRLDGEGMKAKCPQLDLWLVEGGHMLPLTAPETCEALIRDVAARRYAATASGTAQVGS